MKSLLLGLALFGTMIAAPQKSDAATVVHGSRGTAVHKSYGYSDPYWRTHSAGYYHGQYGHWTTTGGKHVFVVQ
jgi:hypothetical protein